MILDEIIAWKQQRELPTLPPLDRAALADLAPCRGFAAALRRVEDEAVHVIAESKKGSPSKGVFCDDYDPVLNAMTYVMGGAHCLSILTDEHFFYGHCDHLQAVREVVDLPIIRKDFIIDERQIAEARLIGADAILLIAACLEPGQLQDLQGFACETGLDVLVEVHNAEEAQMALQAEAQLVGVNNRNLKTFEVDLETTFALLPALLGGDRIVVSESGISSREECQRLEAAGVDAVLVGETLMRADDAASAIKRLRGALF